MAKLIESWQPDFIITLGDNNYPSGAADHMDDAVGQFFHSYIYPYEGNFGDGAEENRFFPALGNHDLITENGKPYYDYFTLPGNERYYDFTWGNVHFFVLNTNDNEPDGVGASSKQAAWLKAGAGSLHINMEYRVHALPTVFIWDARLDGLGQVAVWRVGGGCGAGGA